MQEADSTVKSMISRSGSGRPSLSVTPPDGSLRLHPVCRTLRHALACVLFEFVCCITSVDDVSLAGHIDSLDAVLVVPMPLRNRDIVPTKEPLPKGILTVLDTSRVARGLDAGLRPIQNLLRGGANQNSQKEPSTVVSRQQPQSAACIKLARGPSYSADRCTSCARRAAI